MIGLIDVDGHHFPNLALMRISAYHKAQGEKVERVQHGFTHYDKIYMSKVFSFTPDTALFLNADEVYRGGTGYAISLQDGIEIYNKSKDGELPSAIEKMKPDYSIYPQYDYAVSMTSRGCPRGCPFCHVAPKEGRYSYKVADVMDFYDGQKRIEVLDPNITACKDKHELFRQYKETNANIVFNQGLDIRFLTDEDTEMLKEMKVKEIHFAWDNPKEDLEGKFRNYARLCGKKTNHGQCGTVYVLTNFNSTMEENLYRIYTLRSLGFDPYVMIYDKEHAPREIKQLQRWVNNKWIFWKTERFEEYKERV